MIFGGYQGSLFAPGFRAQRRLSSRREGFTFEEPTDFMLCYILFAFSFFFENTPSVCVWRSMVRFGDTHIHTDILTHKDRSKVPWSVTSHNDRELEKVVPCCHAWVQVVYYK